MLSDLPSEILAGSRMNPYFAPSAAELLAHSSVLEDLSRRLVTDRQTADDIVQDTWLAALEHPPRHSINPAGWLRSVANNLARRDRRTRARQHQREAEAARPEATPGTEESLERDHVLSRVAGAVEALPEPYRTVVSLRFFDNLPPREIAARLEVSLPTVKSQLHRGLERLRTELEDDFGRDGADWRGVLCGCFGWTLSDFSPPAAPSAPHAMPMGTKLAAAAVVLIVVSTVVVNQLNGGSGSTPATLVATSNESRMDGDQSAPKTDRSSLAVAPKSATGTSSTLELQLAIVDPAGSPAPGAAVWIAGPDGLQQRGISDDDGRFSLSVQPNDLRPPHVFSEMQSPIPPIAPRIGVMATTQGFCSSHVSWLELDDLGNNPLPLELNPHGFQLSGHVTDKEGLPIQGSSVQRHDAREGVLRTSASDLAVHAVPEVRTDALGRYSFGSLPLGLSWLRVEAPGYAVHWERLVAHDDAPLQIEFVLERGGGVAGLVLDPEGRPVSNARVWTTARGGVHEIATQTNASGEFHIEGVPEGERFVFVRGSDGGELAARTQLPIRPGSIATWYPTLAPLPAIRFRFVDEDDLPISNLQVRMRLRSPSRLTRADGVTDEEGLVVVYEQSTDIRRIDFYLTARYGTLWTFPDAHLTDIRPGDTEHTVTIEKANLEHGKLRFDFVRSDGGTFEEFTILARGARDGVFRRIFTGRNDVKVTAQNVVPDELELRANCTGIGHFELPGTTVRPGETVFLPEVRAPQTGLVRIAWTYPSGGGEEVSLFQAFGAPRSTPYGIRIPRKGDLSPLETYALFPGEYSLRVSRNGKPLPAVPFTIRSGFETLIEVGPETNE